MTVYSAVVDATGAEVKAYIDGLGLTTISHIDSSALSPQKILVIVEGT